MTRKGSALRPDEIEGVLAPLERARPFPSRAFVDEEVFAFELDAIFARAWICVGREEEQLQHPGRWIREVVAGEPIVVVRGVDLRLRAFFDVCRHRGASIVGCAESGRVSRFECPYHGWTYETDGRLAVAPFAPPGFDRGANGLRAARVETWRGFVFVTLDERLPAVDEWLGESPPWLDEDRSLALGRRVRYEVSANWKLLVENFQESHHFPRVHRALEHLTPTREACTWLPRKASHWLGGTMAIEPPHETVSMDGSRHGRALIFDTKTVHDAMLFPGLLTSLQPDYLLTYRLAPLKADRTQVTADIYFHPASASASGDFRDVYEFWDRVNAEDRAICEDQQRNTSSQAFAPACYVSVEEGMHAFDRMVARIHASANE